MLWGVDCCCIWFGLIGGFVVGVGGRLVWWLMFGGWL